MKVLFQFSIQSFTDVITNSSSELFVFNNTSVDSVISLLDMVHPNWRDEYQDPIMAKDMDEDQLKQYLNIIFFTYDLDKPSSKETSRQCRIAQKFKIPGEDLYLNWDDFDPTLLIPDREKYKTEKSFQKALKRYFDKRYLKLKPNWIDIVKPKLGEVNYNICLFSRSDNPDWNYQESLEQYATRYHLG